MAMGWVEQRVAREQAAIAFLKDRGFSVIRTTTGDPGFWVSGWNGKLSGSELVEIATEHGFEGVAATAPLAIASAPVAPVPNAQSPAPQPSPVPMNPQPEETTVSQVTATINLTGDTADAFRSYAAAEDLTQGMAARALIEQALAAVDVDNAEEQAAPADLADVDTGALFDELRRRFDQVDLDDGNLAAAIENAETERARADAAEARIASLKAGLAELAR